MRLEGKVPISVAQTMQHRPCPVYHLWRVTVDVAFSFACLPLEDWEVCERNKRSLSVLVRNFVEGCPLEYFVKI
jgi:hypothetical protein